MDRLETMRTFVRVAHNRSFAAAARELRTTNATVSRRVSELEGHLGVRLLQRSTRQVSLTEEGRTYLEGAEGVLGGVEALEESVAPSSRGVRGMLRVGVGVSFGQSFLLPRISKLLRANPGLRLELQLDDRSVDLVKEGIDVAIRIGDLADSSLRAQRLSVARHVLCAAPSYIEQRGVPSEVEELPLHCTVVDSNQPREWVLQGPEGSFRFHPSPRLSVNGALATKEAILSGWGLGILPSFVSGEELWSRQLVPVLPNYQPPPRPIHVVHSGRASARVRALVAFLRSELGPGCPPWDRWRAQEGLHELTPSRS